MSKSVLVIETPENCVVCIFCQEFGIGGREHACCYATNGDSENDMKLIDCIYGYRQSKPDWCPLMDLPEKDNGDYPANTFDAGFAEGWNQCIDEITGEVK